jgi:hypothetical protein
MVHSTLERRAKFSSRQAAEAIRSGESFYDGKMDELPGWYREHLRFALRKAAGEGRRAIFELRDRVKTRLPTG